MKFYMRRTFQNATLALLLALSVPPLSAQEEAAGLPPPRAPATSAGFISLPPGEMMVLELEDGLHTSMTRKGDAAKFKTVIEVMSQGQVAIPRGSTIVATVTESRRPGRVFGRARIKLAFNGIILPGGTPLSLEARLSRAGWWEPSGQIEQTLRAEGGRGRDIQMLGQGAAQGALIGSITGGRRGAAHGAAIGAGISAIGLLLERGPELDLPPGMMFEIELTQPLAVPAAGPEAWRAAAPDFGDDPIISEAAADSEFSEESPQVAERTPPSPPAEPALVEAPPVPPGLGPAEYTLRVDVDLILIEATVRDERGRLVDGLRREDFRIFEDETEQEILHFSRDEMPLAVALMVDRSGSVAPYLQQMRRAARETLKLLKPEDQVALFTFAGRTERLEHLTTDRERIADRIATIQPGGGTNITDALFQAALYLGRAARDRRHAVILISDNQATTRGFAGENEVIRLAMETETVIYSIQVGRRTGRGAFSLPVWVPGAGSVNKITRETGGEIFDTNVRSLTVAMGAVIERLKQRYTLGYQSSNKNRDGRFRAVDVRIREDKMPAEGRFWVYARRGYYAPMERAAR